MGGVDSNILQQNKSVYCICSIIKYNDDFHDILVHPKAVADTQPFG